MILFVGNLGHRSGKGPLGGQNIRTRSILTLLKNDCPERLLIADMSKNLIIQSFIIIFGLFACKKVILLPGKNFVQLLSWLRFLFRGKTVYMIAIGGWLHELCHKSGTKTFLMSFESLWVQTEGLKDELSKFGIRSEVLPNFKYVDDLVDRKLNNDVMDVVFCSRICLEKGVLDAIVAFTDLPINYHLHIYGPLHNFDITDYICGRNNITYHGEIASCKVPSVMSQYDVFLFPTFFKGEGFPGVILDAFYAGLPVIASNWKYNAELITHDVGMLIPIKSPKSIVDALEMLALDPTKLRSMSHNSYLRGKSYSPENVSPIIMNKLLESS
jgi:glycosyltransferase involved in cell wall biosynthesis